MYNTKYDNAHMTMQLHTLHILYDVVQQMFNNCLPRLYPAKFGHWQAMPTTLLQPITSQNAPM